MGTVDLGRESDVRWDFAETGDAGPLGAAMIGYRAVSPGGLDLRVAGAAAVTVLIEFGEHGLIIDDADGQRTLGGFVAGLSQSAMRIRSEQTACIEIRLSPIQAYSLLGIAPTDLGRGAIGLEELWGERARRLREQLASTRSWDERFSLTKSFLAQCERPRRTPDSEVLEGWNRIVTSGGQVKIGELAESLGWSHKRLWGRFESQIGLTPKRAAMLVRFRSAVDGLLAGRPAADVAMDCGYSDQAHLCRDVSIFTERSPGALRAHYLPAIAHHRYEAWGRFFQYGGGPLVR
ncbi:helix-turn-helix domain-containing protein [Nocardia sp. NPDC051030]|uniref:AraC family transcriptional regulator n=1 Tax=Nocardia sp. NPDC051030 TaxID=3155162 RepID=UPI00342492A0